MACAVRVSYHHTMNCGSKRPILIAGPTASGKSALALELAERTGGVIVNADSMQVYGTLRVLTARPSADEEVRAPHRLYGHVPPSEAYSVARWLADVRRVLDELSGTGQRPIIVGGTGLYFKALTEGLSPIPEVPSLIRNRWRQAVLDDGAAALHRELARRDPAMAARLEPNDGQRIARALEVLEATGRSLLDWQRIPGTPLVCLEATLRLVVDPPRPWLHDRADRRFDQMIALGALDEVRALAALQLDLGLPAMGALGVRPLMAHLAGHMPLSEAIDAGKRETRQYIKRQQTWLKRHMIAWIAVHLDDNGEMSARLNHLIDS